MSYRNPPIIVDRSTDVWGKAIAGFGQQIAKGILTASEARRKAEKAQAAQARKEAQAQQKLTTATRASYMDEARDKYIQIKKNGGLSLAQQFMKQVDIDLNGGDGEVGAIDASVQLALNNNLTKDERVKYNKIVDSAKMYQAEAVGGFGNLVSGLDYANEKKEDMQTQPGGWSYKGGNKIEMFYNQLLHYALDTDTMINDDVIEDRKTYKGDQGEIFVEATTLVPVEQFNEGATFSEILSENELNDVEKVNKGDKVYYKFSSKKDVREWDGELVTDIPALPDYSKVYQEVNIEDDKGSIATNLISEIQKKEGGYDVEEQILDIGTIRKNLETVMGGQASRIMAGSDQELQAFLNFGLEKGGMTVKAFEKTYPIRTDRLKIIRDSLIDDSINKKFSSEFKSDRKATPDDVKRIKAYNPDSTVKVGDDIRFKRTKQDIIEPEETKKPTEGQIKRADYIKTTKYLDSRFSTEDLTFQSITDLANQEGIKVEKIYASETDENPSKIKLGNLTITPKSTAEEIKKIALIAGGVKPEDAQDIIDGKEITFTINTGNLPITKK
jgi:hypothetical protein